MFSIFKYIYSFFSEISIEKASSEINPVIEVSYVNGRMVLNTENSNYSYGSLHRVFQKVFKVINIEKHELNEVLILGFGAGSVASILLNEYDKKCKITAVELDQKIIDLADKHFNISGIGEINIHQQDAAEFMQNNSKIYDLVVVDVYIDNDVPEHCETTVFIKNLGKAINNNGIIVFNKLVYDKNVEEAAEQLHSRFQNIIGETKIYKIKDNWVNWMLVHYNKEMEHI